LWAILGIGVMMTLVGLIPLAWRFVKGETAGIEQPGEKKPEGRDTYIGRDNAGMQQVFHGPVTFGAPTPDPREAAKAFASDRSANPLGLAVRLPAAVERDTDLKNAIAFVVTGDWGGALDYKRHDAAVKRAFGEFHQLASEGKLLVWGKRLDGHVFEPIQAHYWATAAIDPETAFGDEFDMDFERFAMPDPAFGEFMVSRKQVEKVWKSHTTPLPASSTLRMSTLDLCREAEKQHGWPLFDLNGDHTLCIHFARCIAQGALDGSFKIWGSEKGNFDPEQAAKINPLVVIPAERFEHYWIYVPYAIERNDNRHVKAHEVGYNRYKQEYVNLQVERQRALEWLRVEAPVLMKLHRGDPC
jgi:hypothetical protein